MKYSVVTTFNQAGYDQYARRMIQTWLATWPPQVELICYTEHCVIDQQAPNMSVIDLQAASPELVAFKAQWSHVPRATGNVADDPVRSRRKDSGKGFKWDAVKFSHKVYAIFHAAQQVSTDWLIWMDADMVCHSTLPFDVLEHLCPIDRDLCYLGRQGKYSECGLYALNLRSSTTRQFLADFQLMYDHAESGIFGLMEWHDSFVFDAVRARHPLHSLDWAQGLIRGEGHPLINSAWGAYLDHLKGARKHLGRSKRDDLKVQRTEAYWQ